MMAWRARGGGLPAAVTVLCAAFFVREVETGSLVVHDDDPADSGLERVGKGAADAGIVAGALDQRACFASFPTAAGARSVGLVRIQKVASTTLGHLWDREAKRDFRYREWSH